MWVDESGLDAPKPYFSIAKIFHEAVNSNSKLSGTRERVRGALEDSVSHHLVSDVPVGIFLSSGLDSGAILALAARKRDDLHAVTLAFEEFRGGEQDELPLARTLAGRYGVKHHTKFLTHSDFKQSISYFFKSMDQPTIDGLNVYFISKAMKETGLKVALSGLGGDELFGGYPSFRDIPRSVGMLGLVSKIPFLADCFLGLPGKTSGILKYGGSYKGAYFLRRGIFMPWELKQFLKEDVIRAGIDRLKYLDSINWSMSPDPGSSFGRIAAMEASLYMKNQLLRDADWAGMAHSLEIRTPFADSFLLRRLAPVLLSGKHKGKKLLSDSVSDLLPESVVHRRKTGFALPMDAWLEKDKDFDAWKKIPGFCRPCHWSRRWAYAVFDRMAE
jgi:asparagine synthase (glutamine-hydrolysing)